MRGFFIRNFRCLLANKLRAFLTMGGIAIGVMSVVVIMSIGEMGKSAVNEQMTDMGMDSFVVTASADNYFGLWEKDLVALKNVPEVKNAMPLMNYFTYTRVLDVKSDTMIWGVNEDAHEVIELKVLYGRLLNKGDILGEKKVCVVDEQLALDTYKRANIVGKTVSVKIGPAEEEYEVVGVVSNGVNILQNMFGDLVPIFVYVPYTTLGASTDRMYFDEIVVKLSNNDSAEGIENTLGHAIACSRGRSTKIETENLLKQRSQLNSIADIVTTVLAVIAGVSLVVSGMSVMTVMLVSVKERTREIGIKKSIGASSFDILIEFLTEAAAITASGSAVGVALGLIISFLASFIFGIHAAVSFWAVAGVVAFTVITGVLFGVYPAYKAASLKPVEALRRE